MDQKNLFSFKNSERLFETAVSPPNAPKVDKPQITDSVRGFSVINVLFFNADKPFLNEQPPSIW
jgi:hypothetical protein